MLNDYRTLDARDNYEILPKKKLKTKVNFDDQEVIHKQTISSIQKLKYVNSEVTVKPSRNKSVTS